MASSEYAQFGRQSNNTARPARRNVHSMSFSVETTQRGRNEEDSWVEISSQPSSSSLSSIDNEIITTGLRIQPPPLRRRRATTTGTYRSAQPAHNRSTSSHDEYDESSSDDDGNAIGIRGRISPRLQMTQDIHFPSPSSDENDEDESRTALGIAPAAFTPQPNAFSHPPGSAQTPRNAMQRERDSYFAPQHQSRQRLSHPSTNRAASDAALRASLTTLLSCAQAARSLPKRSSTAIQGPGLARNEMQEFRMVPESELTGTAPAPATAASPALAAMQATTATSPSVRARSSATASSDEKDRKGKRKASSQTRRRKRSATMGATAQAQGTGTEVHQMLTQTVSPTLLTWIVSAGVVVFVSVVGFGAGYAMGYESGKEEGRLLSCGKSSPVRVRRFRWGGGSGITA